MPRLADRHARNLWGMGLGDFARQDVYKRQDIVNAVAAQSERIIIGDIGGAAVPESAPINAGVVAEDAFRTPEEFASIALRTLSDGSSVKLGDVARVEMCIRDRRGGLP